MSFEPDSAGVENNGQRSWKATRPALWLGLAATAGLALCLTATFFLLQGPVRGLRPFRAAPTTIALIIDGQPALVTFPELSENAAAYYNQRIRVTGYYLPLTPPDCSPYNGPIFHWSLVSEGLQLNTQGFERTLSLVSAGTAITLEGIWRLHNGPVGCGKQPETSNVWYLQVERIIQPNPLVAGTADPRAFLLSGINTPVFPTAGPTGTARQVTNVTVAPTDTPAFGPTATPGGTAVAGTPTRAATVSGTTTATATSLGPTATGTPPSGTATATATLTVTPGSTGPPPTPTNPGSYPGPGSTPPPPGSTPSPTPGY